MNIWKYISPIGELTLAAQEDALIGLWIAGQKFYPAALAGVCGRTAIICRAEEWLDRYFAGEQPQIRELPLAPQGSDFRRAVWELLCRIPYGETTTYAAIARELAGQRGRMSAQAVGGAVAHNPISVIIPCHRVLGSDGSLTGYAGGLERKQWLLKFENAIHE